MEKSLQKDPNVINKRCYVSCNLNAWSTENIMMKWMNKKWYPYIYDEDKLNEEGAFS